MTRKFRTDLATLRPVERREDGTILADAHLTRCGVFDYYQVNDAGEISKRRELRLPEEVFSPASLKSYEGRPITDDHPPGMLDAKSATAYARGGLAAAAVRDDDHVRSRLSVIDANTIAAMDAGKTQLSCGYTCDTEETPGNHPVYGPYDAIQRNIVANHVAIVDRGRAGITAAARMDGMSLALRDDSAILAKNMPKKRADDDAEGQTEAERNAALDPKAPVVLPGKAVDKGGGVADPDGDDDQDPDDDDSESDDDMYDDDGDLTAAGRAKIKASNFAVPASEKLPIHDKPHVRAAMSRFGQTQFKNADEKHAAFSRIKNRAKQFGISTTGFEKAHQGNLDKKDQHMTDAEKTAADKAAKKQAQVAAMNALTKRADDAEVALQAANGKIASLEQDLKKAREDHASEKARADGAQDLGPAISAKVDLIARASKTGAKVDAKMDDRSIKVAVITHVDKTDAKALEGKHEQYIEALFEGALSRATTETRATTDGADALAVARVVAFGGAGAGAPTAPAMNESALAEKLRADTANRWMTKETK